MTSLSQLARYRFAGKSEQAVREEWIAPLLVHLGYGVETLNSIRYEKPLRLAKPFRTIGRRRVQVDYLPTVLGRGLWIIEAKAAEREDWDEALLQAWLYATHPEVDVPFMVVTDGSRIAVYDTQNVDWDKAVVDIEASQIERRFGEISGVLGAAHVTRAIRSQRLKHIGAAMRAEINLGALAGYITDVQALADGARTSVAENQRAILNDQFDLEDRMRKELVDSEGLFAIGVWANQPIGMPKHMMGLGRESLMSKAPGDREKEWKRLESAARYGKPPTLRQFTNLRLLRLFIALTCLNEEGCEFLKPEAEHGVRDHILDFPDDELERAAHRLERVLPVFYGRMFRRSNQPDLDGVARQIQEHWSDEMKMRAGLNGDRLYTDAVMHATREAWTSIKWEASILDRVAEQLESSLDRIEVAETSFRGPAGDPYFEWQFERDQLQMATLYELGGHIKSEQLGDDVLVELRKIEAEDKDQRRMVGPAQRLIDLAEGGNLDGNLGIDID